MSTVEKPSRSTSDGAEFVLEVSGKFGHEAERISVTLGVDAAEHFAGAPSVADLSVWVSSSEMATETGEGLS